MKLAECFDSYVHFQIIIKCSAYIPGLAAPLDRVLTGPGFVSISIARRMRIKVRMLESCKDI